MKTFFLTALLAVSAVAQQPKAPKPPVGVPVDAKLFNGKWYRVYIEKGVAWHRAQEKCKALGGQLVTVPDAPTWEFVKSLTPAYVWLGATDEATESVWTWVDGTPMKFADWYANQPDNSGGTEHYLAMWKSKVADIPKHGKVGDQQVVGYICEWKAK
jgi:Lectin C-type domain